MTNQPPTTQQIVIEFLAKTTDALNKLKELSKKSEEAKQKIIEMGKASSASIKEIETALKLATKEDYANLVANLRSELKTLQADERKHAAENNQQAADRRARITELNRLIREQGQAGKEAGTAISQGTRQATEEMEKLKGSTSGVGSMFQSILKGGLALLGITSLVSILQKTVAFLSSAAEQGKEFMQSVFGMAVGVRALQRVGVDITMKDMVEQIERLRKTFGVFSTRDLVVGSAAFLNLNRDMGFTKDQLFALQNAIATLAIVNGRSMDEVQKTVALALSSGYTEGLQRLGVSINRVTIAEEAARLGWEGGYTALNEQQRALATYNLVIRKTAVYEEDMLKYQETLPGQLDMTTRRIQDQTVALGENLVALKLWIKQAELWFLESMNLAAIQAEGTTKEGKENMQKFVDAYIKQREEELGRPLSTVMASLEEWDERTRTMLEARQKYIEMRTQGLSVGQILEQMGLGNEQAVQSEIERRHEMIEKAVESHLDDVYEIQKEFREQSTELWDEYQKDLLEISEEHWAREKEIFNDFASDYLEAEQEHADRVIEIRDEHAEREANIETKYYDDLAKAKADYERGVNNTWTQYNNNLIKAQEAYRNREIDAEARFQEKMLQLREGFIFDLEDALQKRDARQVLNLTRRYALDRKQTEREYKLEKDRMGRDFQQQMADLARQRDERLAQLWEELQTRNAAIEQEYKDELAKEENRNKEAEDKEQASWDKRRNNLAAEYKKRSDDADQDYNDNIKKRDERYGEDLTALTNHMTDRYEAIGKALAGEVQLTEDKMGELLTVLETALGPEGAQAIFKSYIEYASAAAQAAANALAYVQAMPRWIGGTLGNYDVKFPKETGPWTGRHAKGGAEFASQETTATFGEAGPELALFLPLSRSLQGLGSTLSGINFAGGSQGKAGKAAIEILLGPGLEGRIADKTMDMVADVILRRLR